MFLYREVDYIMDFLRQLSVRNNLITAIAAVIFVAFILSRTQPKFVDEMKSRELAGCYYYHDNKLIVENGEIRYSNKVYAINKFRYFKDVLGFDSQYKRIPGTQY
jgi:hypothetical protein